MDEVEETDATQAKLEELDTRVTNLEESETNIEALDTRLASLEKTETIEEEVPSDDKALWEYL